MNASACSIVSDSLETRELVTRRRKPVTTIGVNASESRPCAQASRALVSQSIAGW